VFLDLNIKGPYVYSNKYSFPGLPFYVGKGCSCRATAHFKNSVKKALSSDVNSHKLNKIKSILSKSSRKIAVMMIEERLSEEEAFKLERHFIKAIGRRDLKEGPLTNKTEGGEGSSRYCKTSNKI